MSKEKRIEDFIPVIEEWINVDFNDGYLDYSQKAHLIKNKINISGLMIDFYMYAEDRNMELEAEDDLFQFNLVCKAFLLSEGLKNYE